VYSLFSQLLPTQMPSSQRPPDPGQSTQRPGISGVGGGTEQCKPYAIIKERANPKVTTVCGLRQPRERHLYTSISNHLEVLVTSSDVIKGITHFLIRYEGECYVRVTSEGLGSLGSGLYYKLRLCTVAFLLVVFCLVYCTKRVLLNNNLLLQRNK